MPFDESTAMYLINGILKGVGCLHRNGIAQMEFNLQHILLFPKSISYIIPCIKDPNFGEEIRNFIPKIINFTCCYGSNGPGIIDGHC